MSNVAVQEVHLSSLMGVPPIGRRAATSVLLIWLLVLLWPAGCMRDGMADIGPGVAEAQLESMAARRSIPASIRFHADPQPGQWARYREGGTMVTYVVAESLPEQRWLVRQMVYFVDGLEWIELRLTVDADGRVHAASGRVGQQAGRDRPAGWRQLGIAPPVPPVGPLPSADEAVAAAAVAGLSTRRYDEGVRRYWYTAEPAWFAVDRRTPERAALGGLVRVDNGDADNRRLVDQGMHRSDERPEERSSAVTHK